VRVVGLSCLVVLLTAAGGNKAPPPSPAWIGTFEPAPQPPPSCAECTVPAFVQLAGSVRVLAPSEGGAPAAGDVLVLQPRLGVIVRGHVDNGRIVLAWFNFDRRDGDAGVLVIPGDAHPQLVDPTKADLVSIRAALMRDEVLAGVHKALDKLEVGAIDLDGDHKPDLVVTYGCNAWADGQCQSMGQFFLARHGTSWSEIE
jgi:hypothetical protein